MKLSRNVVITLVLLAICVVIKIYSLQALRVEAGYSTQFFPPFAKFLRKLFGGVDLSIGDILYAAVIGWVVFLLCRQIAGVVRSRRGWLADLNGQKILYKILLVFTSIYIGFNLFWGINYNRKGISWQLDLPTLEYTQSELKEINQLLQHKVNKSKAEWLGSSQGYPASRDLFKGAQEAFEKVARQHPFLGYEQVSLKSSLWGWFGNYAGFNGYYNPFTGEAQINTNVPKFLQPFTACHEVAHQLGYAKEMEANFIGYLAASASEDPLFRYSVYLELFAYANRNLFATDSAAARLIRNKLSEPVKNDLKEWRMFSNKHRSFVEPVVRWGYGIFLRNNEQPQGVLSYDEVTGFLIAYHKKYGTL